MSAPPLRPQKEPQSDILCNLFPLQAAASRQNGVILMPGGDDGECGAFAKRARGTTYSGANGDNPDRDIFAVAQNRKNAFNTHDSGNMPQSRAAVPFTCRNRRSCSGRKRIGESATGRAGDHRSSRATSGGRVKNTISGGDGDTQPHGVAMRFVAAQGRQGSHWSVPAATVATQRVLRPSALVGLDGKAVAPAAEAEGRLFALLGAAMHVAARRDLVGHAPLASRRHRAPTDRTAIVDALFQAAADQSNFVEESVTEFDLRHQGGLGRVAGRQQVETRFSSADLVQ